MKKWRITEELNWGEEFHYVCFNDRCPYYARGWEWMETRFQVHASYRHRINPKSGKASPLPVWSPAAHKDEIMPDPDGPEKEEKE